MWINSDTLNYMCIQICIICTDTLKIWGTYLKLLSCFTFLYICLKADRITSIIHRMFSLAHMLTCDTMVPELHTKIPNIKGTKKPC